MKKIVKVIKAGLRSLFKKKDNNDWAREQILKMANLNAKLIL